MNKCLVVVLLFILAACARPPSAPMQLYPGLDHELLTQAKNSGVYFENLKGLAQISFKNGGRTMNFSSAIVMQKPDKMRIDILSPFGATYVRAASDGEALRLYLVNDGRFFSGPPTAENLARLTRFPIELERMVKMMLYTLPLLNEETHELFIRDNMFVLVLKGEPFTQELLFNAEKRLVGSRVFKDDKPSFAIDYESFEGSAEFPHRMTIESYVDGMILKVAYNSVDLNTNINSSLYRISPPDSVAIEPFPPFNPTRSN